MASLPKPFETMTPIRSQRIPTSKKEQTIQPSTNSTLSSKDIAAQDSVLVPGSNNSSSTSQRVTVGMSSAAAAAAASDIAAGTGGETLAP